MLKNLPLPPSINNLYATYKGHRIKSVEGKVFDKKIQYYKLKHMLLLEEISLFLKDKCIKVDRYFVFHKSRVFCKNGDIKKLDVTNYVKSLDDGLSLLLGIDDRYFKSGVCELMWCEHKTNEQVIVDLNKFMVKEYRGII